MELHSPALRDVLNDVTRTGVSCGVAARVRAGSGKSLVAKKKDTRSKMVLWADTLLNVQEL